MTLKEYAGAAPATRLNGTLSAGTTTSFAVITGGGAGYPSGSTAPFVVVIDRNTALEEKILVTTRATDTFSTLTRGYDGTSAQTHQPQAVVEHVLDAATLTEVSGHVNTTTRDDHTQYTKVDGSRAFTGSTAITAIAGASAPGDTASQGSNHTLARSDHRHSREAAYSAFPIWTTHTFIVSGEVYVASGDTDYICPLFISVASGRTVKLAKARHRINSGTSVNVKLQKNGSDITGFTNLTVGTATTTTDPADVTLADNDMIALIVNSLGGSTQKNMSFTITLEHT